MGTDPPVACSLDLAALAARRAGMLADFVRLADSRERLPDGQRLTFAASAAVLDAIVRTIDAERQCCRFLTFQLTVGPNLGAVVLDLTGPPGTPELLADLIGDSA